MTKWLDLVIGPAVKVSQERKNSNLKNLEDELFTINKSKIINFPVGKFPEATYELFYKMK